MAKTKQKPAGVEALGSFVATSYGPPWTAINGTGVTAGGTDLRPAKPAYIVAVDPDVIPLGSKLFITPNPFNYSGAFLADDIGGAIQGKRLDFYDWRGRKKQLGWGSRSVKVYKATAAGGGTPSTSQLAGFDIGDIPGIGGIAGAGADVIGEGVDALGGPSFDNPAGAIGDILGSPGAALGAVAEVLEGVARFFVGLGELLLTPEGWTRIAKLIGGAIFLLWGLNGLAKAVTGANPGGAVAGVAKTAAIAKVVS